MTLYAQLLWVCWTWPASGAVMIWAGIGIARSRRRRQAKEDELWALKAVDREAKLAAGRASAPEDVQQLIKQAEEMFAVAKATADRIEREEHKRQEAALLLERERRIAGDRLMGERIDHMSGHVVQVWQHREPLNYHNPEYGTYRKSIGKHAWIEYGG